MFQCTNIKKKTKTIIAMQMTQHKVFGLLISFFLFNMTHIHTHKFIQYHTYRQWCFPRGSHRFARTGS